MAKTMVSWQAFLSLPPSLLARPSRFPRAQKPLSLPFQTSATQASVDTKDEIYFKSMYAVQQKLGIDVGTVKRVCDGIKYRKTGISKIDGKRYKFEYVLM